MVCGRLTRYKNDAAAVTQGNEMKRARKMDESYWNDEYMWAAIKILDPLDSQNLQAVYMGGWEYQQKGVLSIHQKK